MTDEVGKLVLRNNYLQTQALSMTQARGTDDLLMQRRLMVALTKEGRLDRKVEFLPDDSTLNDREKTGDGLTRPELAVLLAYAKLALHDAILASDAPDDPYFERELVNYFPTALNREFPSSISSHRLRREIVSTVLANNIVNRGGVTVVPRVLGGVGADGARLARSYITVRDAFGLLDVNLAIDTLDAKIAGATQLGLYSAVQDVTLSLLTWFTHNENFANGVEPVVSRFKRGIANIRASLSDLAKAAAKEQSDALVAKGIPADLARQIAELPLLGNAPDIIRVSDQTGKPEQEVASVFFLAEDSLQFSNLADQARTLRPTDTFDAQARDMAVDRIARAHRGLALSVLKKGVSFEDWASDSGERLARTRTTIAEILASGISVSKLTIASGLLAELGEN